MGGIGLLAFTYHLTTYLTTTIEVFKSSGKRKALQQNDVARPKSTPDAVL